MMENILPDGLVIYLIVPYLYYSTYNVNILVTIGITGLQNSEILYFPLDIKKGEPLSRLGSPPSNILLLNQNKFYVSNN